MLSKGGVLVSTTENLGKCPCDNNNENLCERFAQILDSDILQSSENLCVVTRVRDINPTICNIPTQSPLVINALFSFEPSRNKDEFLNLGETVILQEEINPFIDALRVQGIKVTALHNHWLFEDPRLFYIHFLSVGDPIAFASKVALAFKVLEDGESRKKLMEDNNWNWSV